MKCRELTSGITYLRFYSKNEKEIEDILKKCGMVIKDMDSDDYVDYSRDKSKQWSQLDENRYVFSDNEKSISKLNNEVLKVMSKKG
jgi:hypothetical protein